MAQKEKALTKKGAAARKPAPSARGAVARLEAETEALRRRLAEAEDKVALLERQRDEALNRIEWVIDSLNSLTENVK